MAVLLGVPGKASVFEILNQTRETDRCSLVKGFTTTGYRMAARPATEEEILDFLGQQTTSLTGKEIGQKMGYQGRKDVNRQLHNLEKAGRVRKDSTKQPPEWSLVGPRPHPQSATPPTLLQHQKSDPVTLEGRPLYTLEERYDGTKVMTPVCDNDLTSKPAPTQAEGEQELRGRSELEAPNLNPPKLEQVITAPVREQGGIEQSVGGVAQGLGDLTVSTNQQESSDIAQHSSDIAQQSGHVESSESQPPIPKPRSKLTPTEEDKQNHLKFLKENRQQYLSTEEIFNTLGTNRVLTLRILQDFKSSDLVEQKDKDQWKLK